MRWLRGVEIGLGRWAEHIWPPSAARRSVAVPNGEGVASGSATLKTAWRLFSWLTFIIGI